MNYWDVFVLSLKQWWNHKYLWVIGLIAMIFSSSGSSINNSTPNTSSSDTELKSTFEPIMDYVQDPVNLAIVLVIIITLIICSLLFFFISLYLKARADSALFQATVKIGKNDEKIGFNKTWALGKLRLGTLIKQQLLVSVPVLILVAIYAVFFALIIRDMTPGSDVSTLASVGFSSFWILTCSFFCIILVYAFLVGTASMFGGRISVLENVGTIEGLKKGFDFFISNFKHVFVFWLLTWLSGLVVGTINLMIFGLIALMGVAMVLFSLTISPMIGIIAIIILIFIVYVLLLGVSGPVYAFNQMYWTNVYLEIKKYIGEEVKK